jgi:hypothetical protein
MMTGESYVVIHGPLAGVGPQFHEAVPFTKLSRRPTASSGAAGIRTVRAAVSSHRRLRRNSCRPGWYCFSGSVALKTSPVPRYRRSAPGKVIVRLLLYLIEPLVENPAAGLLQSFAKAGRTLPDRARINLRFTKFNRVANQPGFDPLRLWFDMKLDSEQVRPFPESLGRAVNGACKILTSRR